MLEYQAGIIFLTTNRITDFDKALYSRVHITIEYKALVAAQRRSIWENMAKQTSHDFTTRDFDRLSQIPLDGRSIKNILRVASLHTKMRERSAGSFDVRIGITDVEAVLRFAISDREAEDITRAVEEFYLGGKE
jgi:AAA+ superfamily predicted ATPase